MRPPRFLALLPPLVALSTSPLVAKPARIRTVDVKHLAIDLRFDWRQKRAIGTTTVTLAPFRPTNRITLDAGMLSIATVTSATGTPLAYDYDGGDRDDGLAITLDRIYQAKEDLTIRIAYHTNWVNRSDPKALAGSNGKGLRFFGPTSTEPRKRRQIWSMGEPESNRYWFPGYDAPDDFRTTELTATVDAPLTVVSNGALVATRSNPDGTRTFQWRMDRPYANHLTSIVVGEYVDIQDSARGIALHSFGYPDEAEAVRASAVRLPRMLAFYGDRLGRDHPNPSYSQVFVQDLPWGVGNSGAATLTENMVDDARTHADYFYLWDGLEAEALAHQWFGGSVSAADWSHVWLNRGFAHYFDGLFNEHANGRDEFLLWQLLADQSTYLADWASGVRRPIVTEKFDDVTAFANDNYGSARGAAVLHTLRQHLGDDLWWKAVRHYLTTNAGHPVTTDDLRRSVEATSGEPMQWFFDQWLYRAGHPVLELTKRWDEDRKALVLSVKQAQTPDPKSEFPQVEFFQGKVAVEIDDQILPVWLEPKAENVFTFPCLTPPRLVHFDFESSWIKEITFAKSLDELRYQAEHDRDITGRWWALGELGALAAKEGASAADRAAVQATLRHVIAGSSHWRLRYAAMVQLRGFLAPPSETKPVSLDDSTTALLLAVAREDNPWMRSQAIPFLGMTRDHRYVDLYLEAIRSESHPVIYAAAGSLGKTGSPLAFDALTRLMAIPSWKGENILSGLLGLAALGDRRGVPIALRALADSTSSRWTLATAFWDFRLAGAQTLVALGQGRAGYPIVQRRLTKSIAEDDINDVFSNLLLIATLGDPRGQVAFDLVRSKYRTDPAALTALDQYEQQFKTAIRKG